MPSLAVLQPPLGSTDYRVMLEYAELIHDVAFFQEQKLKLMYNNEVRAITFTKPVKYDHLLLKAKELFGPFKHIYHHHHHGQVSFSLPVLLLTSLFNSGFDIVFSKE